MKKSTHTQSYNATSLVDADDLIVLDELTDPVILHVLRERYKKNVIYVRADLIFIFGRGRRQRIRTGE